MAGRHAAQQRDWRQLMDAPEKIAVILDPESNPDPNLGSDEQGYMTMQTPFGRERVDFIKRNGKLIEPERRKPWKECDKCSAVSEHHICPGCGELKQRMRGIPKDRCGLCCFYRRSDYMDVGECRLEPPRVSESTFPHPTPKTLETSSCRMFKALEYPRIPQP